MKWSDGDIEQYWEPCYYNQSPGVRIGLIPPRPRDYVPPYIQSLLDKIKQLEEQLREHEAS